MTDTEMTNTVTPGENLPGEKEPPRLWTVSAGRYSAIADAFAITPVVDPNQEEQYI